jgi:hypothetical protein
MSPELQASINALLAMIRDRYPLPQGFKPKNDIADSVLQRLRDATEPNVTSEAAPQRNVTDLRREAIGALSDYRAPSVPGHLSIRGIPNVYRGLLDDDEPSIAPPARSWGM